MGSVPVEPGWHLARVGSDGEVAELGPRIAGDHPLPQVLLAIAMAPALTVNDEQALGNLALGGPRVYPAGATGSWSARAARCEGLVDVQRAGLTITASITALGRLTLSVAAALRRAAGRC
jgi:hypothetical protein